METDTVTVARTLVCPLQSSHQKREYLRWGIERYQEILDTMADLMVSVDTEHWQAQDTTVGRLSKKMIDIDKFYAHDRRDAAFKVAEAFGSRNSNDHDGEYPSFGDDDYIRYCSCCTGLSDDNRVRIESNDRGYGLSVRHRKYGDGEWFHVGGGQYQYDALDDIVDGEATLGNVEVHCSGEQVTAHISYTREIAVPVPKDVPRFLGVDVGQNTLVAGAVITRSGEVVDVNVVSGDEQRHHRRQLAQKQERRQMSGKRQRATGVTERQKYTEHVMHQTSREVVDQAVDHHPCAIVLEDLTDYRKTASNANHEWPYRSLQEKIVYKVAAASIPVVTVDSEYTSKTCRKCGHRASANRAGSSFECQSCGYQVHADVNAAINIAHRGMDDCEG